MTKLFDHIQTVLTVALLVLLPSGMAAQPRQELMKNMVVFTSHKKVMVMSKEPAIPGGQFMASGAKGRPIPLDTNEHGWGWNVDDISKAYAKAFTDDNSVVFFHWHSGLRVHTWYIQLRSDDGIGYSVWRLNNDRADVTNDAIPGYHIQPIVLGDNYFRRVAVTDKGYLILTNRRGVEIQVPPSSDCNAPTYFNPY